MMEFIYTCFLKIINRYLDVRINTAASRRINGHSITRANSNNIRIGTELVEEFMDENPEIHIGNLQRNAFILNTARTHLIQPVRPPTTFTYNQLGYLDRMVI